MSAPDTKMKIAVRESGAVKIVDLEGDVGLVSSAALRKALLELLRQAPKLAINLQALRYIDSSGIATFVELYREALRQQKQFVLFGLSPMVEEVFRLTHVNRIFQIFDNEEEAVAAA